MSMKKRIARLALCLRLAAAAASATAAAAEPLAGEAAGKAPLPEIFDELVVIPYEYQGKVFVNGTKQQIYGDYVLVQRNDRVLVPIRMMGELANLVYRDGPDAGRMYWDVRWNPEQPDEVLLVNSALGKTVQFTVGSHTMTVNGMPKEIDVPAQKVNGRIMLPLRSAAEALEMHIDWLDGLILFGTRAADLQHPETAALVRPIKEALADARSVADADKLDVPVALRGGTIFYYTMEYGSEEVVTQFFKKTNGKSPEKLRLAGTPLTTGLTAIGDELYYVTVENGQAALYAHQFETGESRRVALLDEWTPGDGWVTSVRELGGELFVVLHYGDLTMGSDTVYRVKDGALRSVFRAKSLLHLVSVNGDLYYTDFRFMGQDADNLLRIDAESGETVPVGQPGYAYGIYREVEDGQGVSYRGTEPFAVIDGYFYIMAYRSEDMTDKPAVYRLNPADGSQVKLTGPAERFWVADGRIVYVDADTGYLRSAALDGSDDRVLAAAPALKVQIDGEYIYFLSNGQGTERLPGRLYRVPLAGGDPVRLSGRSAAEFAVAAGSVYYVSHGYEPGLYRIDPSGKETALVRDSIRQMLVSEDGAVYSLIYEHGVYAAE